MKKVILSLAVLFSVAMVSCGDKKAAACDSDSCCNDTEVVADSNVDSAAADTDKAEEVAPATDSNKVEEAK